MAHSIRFKGRYCLLHQVSLHVTKQTTILRTQIMANEESVSITKTCDVVNFCPGFSDGCSTFG